MEMLDALANITQTDAALYLLQALDVDPEAHAVITNRQLHLLFGALQIDEDILRMSMALYVGQRFLKLLRLWV